jgi:hypothetical protein
MRKLPKRKKKKTGLKKKRRKEGVRRDGERERDGRA